MKKTNFFVSIFLLLLYAYPGNAQIVQDNIKTIPYTIKSEIDKGQSFYEYEVFNTDNIREVSDEKIDEIVSNYTLLSLNVDDLKQVIDRQENTIRINIPNAYGEPYDLELVRADIFTSDFTVKTSGESSELAATGVHYQGIVSGNYHSLVALSFFENEIMGFISKDDKNLVVAKLEGENTSHIFYETGDLTVSSNFSCDMPEDYTPYSTADLSSPAFINNQNCVNIYVEVDHDIFQDKGANTANYIMGLFNQSATLYANDGIEISMSELLIWTNPDPYTANTSADILIQFQAFRTSFNGDLGHLVSYGDGGRAAGFSGLCNPDRAQSMCYSGIHPTFSTVPVYSWSVSVFTHEMGHLLGSRHTHACVWNGNATAIDGCAGGTEGNCPLPGNPPNGGTIMSYCHLQPVRINFNNGFGPQPRNVILNNIANATCLSPCCLTDIIDSGPVSIGHYEASNSIVSTGTIGSNQNVVYDAGNFISLEPGFMANSGNGSVFFAVIDGCEGLYRIGEEESSTGNITENSVTFKNYPNPFTQQTTIEFTLSADAPVTLLVFDSMGRKIASLLNAAPTKTGTHQVTFDGTDYPSGVYYYSIRAGAFLGTQKMTLIK